jgi:hypothetical protein
MKKLAVAVLALSLFGITAAGAAPHRHRVCTVHHHHRVCHWR